MNTFISVLSVIQAITWPIVILAVELRIPCWGTLLSYKQYRFRRRIIQILLGHSVLSSNDFVAVAWNTEPNNRLIKLIN